MRDFILGRVVVIVVKNDKHSNNPLVVWQLLRRQKAEEIKILRIIMALK